MDTKEFRAKIAEAKEKEWFNSREFTIHFQSMGTSGPFTGLSSLHLFLSEQIEGWEKFGDSIPADLMKSKEYFTKLKSRIESFLSNYLNKSKEQLDGMWREEESHIKSNSKVFTYDSPETKFLLQLHKKYPKSFPSGFNFLTGGAEFNTRDQLIGSLLAYEFFLKDDTQITERVKKEKASINKLKEDLTRQITASESHLSEHLANAVTRYKEYTQAIDQIKNDKEKSFQDWFDTSKKGYSTFEADAKKKIAELEKTYEELLRLKKPAEYWNHRAATLKKEGWKSFYWLIGSVAIVCITLYMLLWLTPEGMLLSFDTNKSGAIKWSIIYVTFLSFLAFVVRALYKVSFSSFHLARDAEEREQLTYVYLSLIKESAVDEKEKSLIMQSLFSRADTGLLKEDSSPTMPNDLAGKIFGK
ncbi:MAG: hypothetical protein JNK77_19570 [Saprospiraceae bacterium]|nr:hypothetical protein [Saprospiraceae bacterium]